MRSEPWSVRKRITVAIAVILGTPLVLVLSGVALFIAYMVGWFNAGIFFSGDGVYRKGVDGAAFQVAFPPVDLSRAGSYTFHFTRLGPSLSYAVGFHAARQSPALVAMTMRNERGEIVFQEKRRLSEWTWNRDLAVINGVVDEIPIGGGSVRIQPRGVGPDGGWGTHFAPRWSGRYALTIDVLEPDRVHLVARPVIEGYMAWF